MGNVLVGQSGGPTVAINASLSGVVRQAMKTPAIGCVYGALNGVDGILEENIVDLAAQLKDMESFQRLERTPSMVLGSCRHRLAARPDEVYHKILRVFEKYDIKYFFYIGGNDSMDTVDKLSRYFQGLGRDIRCVGIPKTIDNDLPMTDHTPGFGSAAKYIATVLYEIAYDSAVYDLPSVTIVEIMGRNAGWLTAAATLARSGAGGPPHMVCLPETPFCPAPFFARLRELLACERQVVVAVSEGIRYGDGRYVASAESTADAFGHVQLAGVGAVLENLVKQELGCKTRAVELSVLQRSAAHLASAADIGEAVEIGQHAVRQALGGKTGVMATIERVGNAPYLVEYGTAPTASVANLERKVPKTWIDTKRFDVRPEMEQYLRPLIAGSLPAVEKDGIPDYFTIEKGA